jgi:hypothetical protein
MKLPKITNKQQEIVALLYRYRFLNRIQIQALMHHKDRKTINLWLRDLREKHYVEWIYSTDFLEKTKPAIYYLGINGVRFLRQQTITSAGDSDGANDTDSQEHGAYPVEELRKRYREHDRSESFRTHSILLADCCINLQAKTTRKLSYDCYTQADYTPPGRNYHFLSESDIITPDLCIIKNDSAKRAKGSPDDDNDAWTRTNYLLEIFDPGFPHYRIRYRLKQYATYLIDDEWDSGDNDPPPIILLVCPRTTDLIYAKRRTRKLLLNEYYDDEDEIPKDVHLRFTTIDQLNNRGITANIWEEGRNLYSV